MKKKCFVSALLSLLLILPLSPRAHADEYIALGSYTAGREMECPITTVNTEEEPTAEGLPADLRLEVREGELGRTLYLAGRPMAAGDCLFSVWAGESITCSLQIRPAAPTVTLSGDVSCRIGEDAALTAFAQTEDAGSLSYQWCLENGMDVWPIEGATDSVFHPDTSTPGIWRFYCEVSNNNGSMSSVVRSDPVTVTVRMRQLSSVSIETLPLKMDYAVGENFDPAGLSLRLTYDNGEQELITDGYTLSVDPLTTPGTHVVKVSYEGLGWSFYVNVQQKKSATVSGIGVLTLPNKREYLLGESLQTAGLSIRVYTDDGEHYDLATDLDCSPTVFNSEGEQIVTVRYAEKTCTFKVTVKNDKVVTGISVLSLPSTRSYTVGDYLDITGLQVQLNSNKGSETLGAGSYTVSPKVFSSPGTQEVTVRYDKYTTRFSVTVKAKEAVTPTPRPTPTPAVSPSASPAAGAAGQSPAPGASPDVGASARPVPAPVRENTGVSAVVKVFFVVAVLALAGLAGYIWYLRKEGIGEEETPAAPESEAPAVYGEPIEPDKPAEPDRQDPPEAEK